VQAEWRNSKARNKGKGRKGRNVAEKKRRGRSEGAVFQRESDGRWCATVSNGYAASGKRRRNTLYGWTKREVLDKLKKLHRSDVAEKSGPSKLTVAQWLDQWLASVRPALERSTYNLYSGYVENHLKTQIGGALLKSLTRDDIEGMVATLLREGHGAALVGKVLTTLKTALRAAAECKPPRITGNPAAGIKRPKVTKEEISPMTALQVGRLLAAAAGDRLAALYPTAVDSGCRQGELFALRWTDFDRAAGTIRVNKSLGEIGGEVFTKEPKTKRSRRSIALSFCLSELLAHRERMQLEGRDVETGIIFCATDGGYLRKKDFYRDSLRGVLARAGLSNVRFHDVRHTCASLLLAAGVNVKVVSERLGHTSTTITLEVYSHLMPGQQAGAAAALAGVLNPAAVTSKTT
jgi:integrase